MSNTKHRGKPIIEDALTPDQFAELESKLKVTTFHGTNRDIMRQYPTNFCSMCDRPALKRVMWNVSDEDGDGTLVERYCPDCWNKVKDSIE